MQKNQSIADSNKVRIGAQTPSLPPRTPAQRQAALWRTEPEPAAAYHRQRQGSSGAEDRSACRYARPLAASVPRLKESEPTNQIAVICLPLSGAAEALSRS